MGICYNLGNRTMQDKIKLNSVSLQPTQKNVTLARGVIWLVTRDRCGSAHLHQMGNCWPQGECL